MSVDEFNVTATEVPAEAFIEQIVERVGVRRTHPRGTAQDYADFEAAGIRTRCEHCNRRIPIVRIVNGIDRGRQARFDRIECKRNAAQRRLREKRRAAESVE